MVEVGASPGESDILLDVRNLTKHFPVTKGLVFQRTVAQVKAVDDVSFSVHRGEVLGLVGESGCGKTTVARCILKLLEPTGGQIVFDGHDIADSDKTFTSLFRRQVQAIFQDPYSSLNPRMTVGQTIGEPFHIHGEQPDRFAIDGQVRELLDLCGLPRMFADRYPHEMSGGQRQRVGIARALALKPRLIVCDEAVSALDVSIQAQIINLLEDLQAEFGLTYLFIGHDLSVINHICPRPCLRPSGSRPVGGTGTGSQGSAGRGAEPARSTVRLRIPSALFPGRGPLPDACSRPRRTTREPLGSLPGSRGLKRPHGRVNDGIGLHERGKLHSILLETPNRGRLALGTGLVKSGEDSLMIVIPKTPGGLDKRIKNELKDAYDFDSKDPLFSLGKEELSGPSMSRRAALRLMAAAGTLSIWHLMPGGGTGKALAAGSGTLRCGWAGVPEIQTIDPAKINQALQFQISSNIISGLMHIDAKLVPQGDLAESWKVSDDGKEWIFNLREGVTFHNGDRFTAEDVVFTYLRSRDPKNSLHSRVVANVKEVVAVNDHSRLLSWARPWSGAPDGPWPSSAGAPWRRWAMRITA
jgi:ABC-type oligopeptide transport system ATPase subunit